MTPFERCDLCNRAFCNCRMPKFEEAVVLIPTTKSNPELAAKVAEETKQILKDMRSPDTHTLPKRFKKLVWFTMSDNIPASATYLMRCEMMWSDKFHTNAMHCLYEVPEE